MNTLITYHNFFKDLATRHKSILHTEDEKHFARINLSKHPIIGAEDLREFFNSQAKHLKTPFVLSSAPEYQNQNNEDNPQRSIMGEFFIMGLARQGDYEEQESTMDAMKEIAEDFVAEMIEYYSINEEEGKPDFSSINIEFVNNVTTKGYCGAKCYFTILADANGKYVNKSSKFND